MAISFVFFAFITVNSLSVLGLSAHTAEAVKIFKELDSFDDKEQDIHQEIASLNEPLDEKRTQEFQTITNLYLGHGGKKRRSIKPRMSFSNSHRTSKARRVKRVVYGADDRYLVPRHYAGRCPFTTAVIISTGCSGVLVSPKHVLTSAHCLHNGSHFVDGYAGLRVGFQRKNDTIDWRPVLIGATKIPEQWKNGSDTQATRFDYALIKLARRHSRCFLAISASKAYREGDACVHRAIHFTAFDEDRNEGTMLYRACRVETFNTYMLFHCCDAARGSSGAGVYEIRKDKDTNKSIRYIIGVFSGNRDLYLNHPPSRCPTQRSVYNYYRRVYVANYNAVLRFNEDDILRICGWMRRLGGATCKRLITERRRFRKRREKYRETAQTDECENVL